MAQPMMIPRIKRMWLSPRSHPELARRVCDERGTIVFPAAIVQGAARTGGLLRADLSHRPPGQSGTGPCHFTLMRSRNRLKTRENRSAPCERGHFRAKTGIL